MRGRRSKVFVKWQLKSFTDLDNEGICHFEKGNIQISLRLGYFLALVFHRIGKKGSSSVSAFSSKNNFILTSFLIFLGSQMAFTSLLHSLQFILYYFSMISVILCIYLLVYTFIPRIHQANMLGRIPGECSKLTVGQEDPPSGGSYYRPFHYLCISERERLCK